MKKQSASLLLMELIITILLFSVSAAVCVGMLARAHRLDRTANELSGAVNCVSSACETISAAGSCQESLALLEQLYPGCVRDPEGCTVELNARFQPVQAEEAAYEMHVRLLEENGMLNAAVDVTPRETQDAVYERNITIYLRRPG